MKITPIFSNILVKPENMEKKTREGIFIVEEERNKPIFASVIAIGQGEKEEKMQIQVGQKVIFPEFAAIEINLSGEKYFLLSQNDVYGILD